ncbi:MAG: thioredoxin family protein [Alphaproteobacteria bacterium]|nr:thioredoxin family protein [Alphaproteobacteria bacterium]
MKDIKVLGGCCGNCDTVMKLFESRATALGVDISLQKISDMPTILGLGVMSTPGVVIDGKVVHAGGIPTSAKIDAWLKE